ncbi:hypothetical protein [Streptomyces silvisoli]|uniref:Uncharacterized protein n=1 Tax=Streptomyces silvisoli TaxID=3034235 RepID=A0ABT5ZPX7_9ACTN|nr:hypothetical protein [Streptomyces silvisoli]MDF3291885.1 hypothetical protein [Streptomyces silvisoli]
MSAPTAGRTTRADLPEFATALADRLPGTWMTVAEYFTERFQQHQATERLWAAGHLDWAVREFVHDETALLIGPGDELLLVFDRPLRRDQFLVGAVAPPGVDGNLRLTSAPDGVAVSRDPARAASTVSRRLLPRYHQAVDDVRLPALAPDATSRPACPTPTAYWTPSPTSTATAALCRPLARGPRPPAPPPRHASTSASQQLTHPAPSPCHPLRPNPGPHIADLRPVSARADSTPASPRPSRQRKFFMPPEPDVAFGRHPHLGVAAAVRDGLPQAETILRHHGFTHHRDLDIYTLPSSMLHGEAVRRTAQATAALQAERLTVAVDPRVMYQPTTVAPSALVTQVGRARNASDITDLIDSVVDGYTGAVPELELFLQATANWGEERLGPAGSDIARRFEHLSERLAELAEDLCWTGVDLVDLTGPAPARDQSLPASIRARAATAASPAADARKPSFPTVVTAMQSPFSAPSASPSPGPRR